jgi:Glycosyl hydrolase family 30 beta sandwich domain
VLVTTYAVLRPDGQWSLLVINKDQENTHAVNISFDDAQKKTSAIFTGPLSVTTFGKA